MLSAVKSYLSSIISQTEPVWLLVISGKMHEHNEAQDIKEKLGPGRNINFVFVTQDLCDTTRAGCITEEWFMWMMSSCSTSSHFHPEKDANRGRTLWCMSSWLASASSSMDHSVLLAAIVTVVVKFVSVSLCRVVMLAVSSAKAK